MPPKAKFNRNEILTANEVRQIIGMKPSNDPKADELRNSNINQANENGAGVADPSMGSENGASIADPSMGSENGTSSNGEESTDLFSMPISQLMNSQNE